MAEWQPIETAPKDGSVIRIRPSYGLPEMQGQWQRYACGREGFAFIAGHNVDPTHWKPAQPTPPHPGATP